MFQNFLLCLPLGFAVVAFDAAAFERTVATILAGIDGFFRSHTRLLFSSLFLSWQLSMMISPLLP